MAFGFGLVHGFGFSFALRESLQFAGGHLAAALLAFNLGVEAGQLAALAGMLPVLVLLFRRVVRPRMGVVLASAFVAHAAWHWTADPAVVLSQFRWEWTTRDSALALRGVLAGMVAFAALVVLAPAIGARVNRYAAATLLRRMPMPSPSFRRTSSRYRRPWRATTAGLGRSRCANRVALPMTVVIPLRSECSLLSFGMVGSGLPERAGAVAKVALVVQAPGEDPGGSQGGSRLT
jgi:hypothetical protein